MNHPPTKHLTAEVISIGDEMTSGARLDTNGQWLSRRLGSLGIDVQFHTTVGDSLAHNVAVFRAACERADVVITTGGLGPTRDDLTRDVLAILTAEPLQLRGEILAEIQAMFTRRGRLMAQRNEVQAMFPRGSRVVVNPHGTAPGIDCEVTVANASRSISRVFALPGVPVEMKQMFDETVAPRLMEIVGDASFIRHHAMKFFGTGESDMEQRLGDMIARDRLPRVGITVSAATISLRISAVSDRDAECQRLIDATRAEILERVGDLFFGEGEHFEQYHAIDLALRTLEQSLTIVELGYAAPLGDWFATLGDTPSYRGGLSLASLEPLLKFTSCSTLTEAMQSLKSQSDASWVLVVDRYPILPSRDDAMLPPTEFCIHILDPAGRMHEQLHKISGHPDILHARVAKMSMAFLRARIANVPTP